ncbi:MAG: multidrug efflux pump subunit AcrB [Halieaceae bacterium]|jgi:multidrug efflux pump subunit AcrB
MIVQEVLRFFIHRPLLVNMLVVFFFICGAMALTSLPYNNFPPADTGVISVTTHHPGASAEDVELNITTPLERQFLHIDGVDRVYSSSMEGQSTIQIASNPNDPVWRYDAVEEEVYNAIDRARAELPANLPGNPIVTRPENVINSPLAHVLITGTVPESTLRALTRQIRLEIRNLEGVSGVQLEGYREREVHILLDQVRMQQLGISHAVVAAAIQSRNVQSTGGSLDSAAGEQDILTIGKFEHPSEVAEVIIHEGAAGDFVRLKDIARIHDDFADPTVRSRINGQIAITMQIKAEEFTDRLSTANGVREYVDKRNRILPADVHLYMVNDESKITSDMLEVLVGNALFGIVLVVLVLLCFFSFRLTIWVALGIPTAIMMVFAVMPLLGLSINLLSMAALILMLGILVDDAVVVAESIFRFNEYGHSPEEAAILGTSAVTLPVLAAALTTIIALAPAAFMGGVQGKIFWIIPVMAILVLTMSLFEAKLILPSHIAHSMHGAAKGKLTRPWFTRFEDGYESLMTKVIPHRVLFVLATLAGMIVVAFISTQFLVFVSSPETNADVVYIKMEAPIGTPFAETEARLLELEQELRALIPPGDLEAVVVTTGHHDHDVHKITEGSSDSWGLISAFLKPANDRETNSLEVRDILQKKFEQRQGYRRLSVRVLNMAPPMGWPLETAVIGNSDERFAAAEELTAYARTLPGVEDLWTNYTPGKPIISLKIDYESLKRYKLTVNDVSSAVKVAFNGQIVDTFHTIDENIGFRIYLDGIDPADPAALRSLVITNRHGEDILLRSVVDFEQRPGEGTIFHYLGDRAITVAATIDRDKTTTYVLNARVATLLEDPEFRARHPNVTFYQGGEMVTERQQAGETGKAFALALIGIIFILILLFKSLLQPIMVLFLIPLGVVGVFAAFAIQSIVLSMAAMVGVAGLMGVIVNDALVMLDRFNTERELHSADKPTLLHDRQIIECASIRLRPIVITTVTTCAGLFPAAYEIGGSNELITPMIMVMFWGVLIASLITLFFLPCLYALDRDLKGWLNPDYARQPLDDVIMYN